uniref:CDT1 domain-containing protein n=1 Tax=Onchocerca volvulus TaxID=6282 RepID=A0A8R1TQB8_ONCVO
MDWPIAASASTGQTKVTEYFPVHRGPTKKLERFKVLIDSEEEKNTEKILESPRKMARLKSPQAPSLEKKTESNSQEWVLPITCLTSDETEAIPKTDKVKESDSNVEESNLEVTENNKLSICATREMTETMAKEERILPSAVRLVESIKNSTGSILSDTLPLPAKYERLLRLFDYTEVASHFLKQVVSWLETQGKRITLNEVMTNVRRKLKSNYDEDQFAMILSIYPESYNVRCERRWMPIGGRHCNLKEYEYVIEPNLINDIAFPLKENLEEAATSRSSPTKSTLSSPCKVPLISLIRNPMVPSSMKTIMKCPPKLENHRLHRKLEFKNRLRKLVNVQHAAFLKNEGIEISPDEQLPRYHPDFDLDAIDDITPAKLPEMPKRDVGQSETMREYLKTVPDSSDTLPDKIKMVIKELRSPEKKVAVVADKCIPLSPKKYVETKNTSKPSLLERIRAKERERKRREMMRSPEMEQKKGRLEKISHSLLQCICSYYNLKRVGSMKFVELIDKLAFGIGSISKVEIEATISLLCEICPTYFKMVEVRGEKYIQLKDNNFSAIQDIVNAEIKKCI